MPAGYNTRPPPAAIVRCARPPSCAGTTTWTPRAVQGRHEPVGIGLDDRRTSRNGTGIAALTVEKAPHRQRRDLRPHGEAVADRHDDDVGLVDLGDQRHVAEDIGVAHMIDRRLAGRLDDDAVGAADRRVGAHLHERRGMIGPDERDRKSALVGRAAGIHGIEAVRPCDPSQPARSAFVTILAPVAFGDGDGVADMVAMAVRDENMRRARARPSRPCPRRPDCR